MQGVREFPHPNPNLIIIVVVQTCLSIFLFFFLIAEFVLILGNEVYFLMSGRAPRKGLTLTFSY